MSELPDAAHRPSSRDLPSLDGLRALSIGCVVLGHWCHGHVPPRLEPLLARLAHFGVCVFFVISGYLITTLLQREVSRNADIDLPRFYYRRTLRIFPPYYIYLAVVALGVAVGSWTRPADTRWWPAVAYLSNFFSTKWGGTGHGWSLSLEEQFYLTWPVMFCLAVRRAGADAGTQRASSIAFTGLLILPVVRLLVFLVSRNGTLTSALLFDYVAAGSGMALLNRVGSHQRGQSTLIAVSQSTWAPFTGVAALVLHVTLAGSIRWVGLFDVLIITPIEALLLAVFVCWAVSNPRSVVGRVLNMRPLRMIGVVSYSLYLWQQLFFGPGASFVAGWSSSAKFIGVGVCTMASYAFVERPILRLRQKWERILFTPSALLQK
jgi:peptidoglycan/LPS O-acetylase OafA/YrhL